MASSTYVFLVAAILVVGASAKCSQGIEKKSTVTANSTWTAIRNNGSSWCLTPSQYKSTAGANVNNFNCYAYMPGPQGFPPETHKNFYMWGFTTTAKSSWLVYNLGGLCVTASSSPWSSPNNGVWLQPCDCANKQQRFKHSKTGQLVLGYHPRLAGVNGTCHSQTYSDGLTEEYEEAAAEINEGIDYDDELDKPIKSKSYLCLAGLNTLQGGGVAVQPCNATDPLQIWNFEPWGSRKSELAAE